MSTLVRHVALVPDDNIAGRLPAADVSKVAAALQKQAVRDFSPVWNVNATVDGFASLDDVPLGYWPILVGNEGQGGGGVHLDQDNQPYALVDFTPDWTVTASHECMEMLADPFGNRLVAGDSPDPNRPGRVEFLVEVCDPCEVPNLGYTVNGIRVSDFYTPRYLEPSQPASTAGGKYDFMGHLTAPRQVLRGGYLSWKEADGTWFQELFFGAQPEFKNLGHFDKSFGSLRAWIDSTTLKNRTEMLKQRARFPNQVLSRLPGEFVADNDMAGEAAKRKASGWREEIRQLRSSARASARAARPAEPAGGRKGKGNAKRRKARR